MFADLHLHTHFSDGTFSPEELALAGKRHDLTAMSLTDHDTVEGCPRMAIACQSQGIEFITGTELTAEIDGNEVHLLGYFIDINNEPFLTEIAKFQKVRQNRIVEMVACLNKVNVPLKLEAVQKLANCQSPGRPHVARALVEGGFCRSMEEAFDRFLKKNRAAWVPKFKMSALDAIALIHGAGGLAVLAHPGLNRDDKAIPQLVAAGLDGIECFHTRHSKTDSQRYLAFAAEHKLLITGGSDCHGMSKWKPLIGGVKLPYEHIEAMKQRRTNQ